MFERISNSFKKRFGIKTIMGVVLACALAGFSVSGMFGRIGRAAAEPAPIHSQSGSEQPVISSPFTALAEKCTPTVVNVKVTKVEKTGFGEMQIPTPFRDFFNQPWSRQLPQDRTVQGAGSGVIISKDGYILTNNHVVENAKELTVTMADKGEFKAQVIGRDPKTDLAIVKIDAGENLPGGKRRRLRSNEGRRLGARHWKSFRAEPHRHLRDCQRQRACDRRRPV